MRKVLLAAIGLLAVLGVMLAVPAFSSSSSPRSTASVPRQLRQLNAKIRLLQTRVSRLEKSVDGIKACTSTVQGLTRFTGYVGYDGVNYYTTSAVDVPDAGETVGAYFVLADPACVTGGSAHVYSLAKPPLTLSRASGGETLNGLMHVRGKRSSARTSAGMSPDRLNFRQR